MVREGASCVGVMAAMPVHWCSGGGRAELAHGQKKRVKPVGGSETVRGSLRQLWFMKCYLSTTESDIRANRCMEDMPCWKLGN